MSGRGANGIVVLTALPPTMGHAYLIDFASRYIEAMGDHYYPLEEGILNVIVCARPNEPIDGMVRASAIANHFSGRSNVWVHLREANDPNLPEDHPDFWAFWKGIVESKVNKIKPNDILFASEIYGIEFAKHLGCRFMPCDVERAIVDTKATAVRQDPIGKFDYMLPEFSRGMMKTVTFFGAESTGKTTLSRKMATRRAATVLNGHWCHEWARPFLELCGPETTDERMTDIVYGQFAAQTAVRALPPKPFIFQDTDLLSTIGYYRIYGGKPPADLEDLFRKTKSDLYIVMSGKIPFAADILRYGGDHRESSDEFWIDLLKEYGCSYYAVTETDQHAQFSEISDYLKRFFLSEAGWAGFPR